MAPPDGEACARPARPTRSLWAPSRHDFDARAFTRALYVGSQNHAGPANVLSCASRLSGLCASLRPSARPRFRFGLVRAPHEPPTSGGYRRGSIPPRPLSPSSAFKARQKCRALKSFASEVPRIVHAKVAYPRHVRYLSRDTPTRTLEEKANVQFLNLILNRKKLLRGENEPLGKTIRGQTWRDVAWLAHGKIRS